MRGRLRVLLCLPPARTSNELDLFRAMPETHLVVASQRDGLGADEHVVLPTRRLPVIGLDDAWTAAPAWLGGLSKLEAQRSEVVASLELYSFGSYQASRLAARTGVAHVVTIFETLADNPLYRLPPWWSIARRVARTARLFVCFSDKARRHALELGCAPDRCVVVYPGVDTHLFRPRDDRRAPDPTVLFVGMLRADRGADKGVLQIVDACERLSREIDGLHLVLVGDGHLRGELAERAARRPFLEVLGPRPRSEIPALLRDARVFVLASRRTWKWEEQFGFALVEAMATGLPVVATRSGVIPEIVPSWNPLADEGDVDELAEGLCAALGSDGDRWGEWNRADALERFDLSRQGAALYEVLCRVAEDHMSARPDPR